MSILKALLRIAASRSKGPNRYPTDPATAEDRRRYPRRPNDQLIASEPVLPDPPPVRHRGFHTADSSPPQPGPLPPPETLNPTGDHRDLRDLQPKSLREVYAAAANGEDILYDFLALPINDQLTAIEEAFKEATPDQQQALLSILQPQLDKAWIPLPGPQTMAYKSIARTIGYGGAAGAGKAVAKMQHIATPFGSKAIFDLKVGDKVCAVDGTTTEVIAKSPLMTRQMYRFTFHDGTTVECSDDHIWQGWWTGKARKVANERTFSNPANYTTAEIIKRREKYAGNAREHRFAIPVISSPVNYTVAGALYGKGNFVKREVDPYLLGLWLGNGSGNVVVTPFDEVVEWVTGQFQNDVAVDEGSGCKRLRFRGESLLDLRGRLEQLMLWDKRSWEKFIPRIYLFGSADERWRLLQGLMDTDGWAETDQTTFYCTTSPQLRDDVCHLVRSLGAIAFVRDKHPTYTYKGEKFEGRPAWTIEIKMPEPDRMFTVEKKAERCRGREPQSMAKFLVDVEDIGQGECLCIGVRHHSSLYVLAESFTVTHNTDLMLGLAGQEHTRSLLVRREGVQFTRAVDRCQEIFAGRGRYVSQPVKRFNFSNNDRVIIFGHCKEPNDWRNYAGQDRDFLAFDEATEFLKDQIYGLSGWVRTAKAGQRERILFATNPPRGAEGYWFINMFWPWLDENSPTRAAPGEVRWAITKAGDIEWINDDELLFDERGQPVSVMRDFEPYTPQSFTFIPGRIDDNPYLIRSGYKAQLQALPEPLRSQLLYGSFSMQVEDDAWQVIPTEWIDKAMERWDAKEIALRTMTVLGVDVAQGGSDRTSLAPLYGNMYDRLQVHHGVDTKDGPTVTALVVGAMRDRCKVVVDKGGGWGGSTIDHLKGIGDLDIVGFDPSTTEGISSLRSREGFKYFNMRAYAWWAFREALDPVYGQNIALPPDPELKLELTMPRWKKPKDHLQIESKEDIRKRLQRSTDLADPVIMAWAFSEFGKEEKRTRRGPVQRVAKRGYERFKRSR